MAIFGKILGLGGVARLFGYGCYECFATGVAMVPRADVALIIAHFGFKHNVLDANLMYAIVIVSIVTTLITPILLNGAISKI